MTNASEILADTSQQTQPAGDQPPAAQPPADMPPAQPESTWYGDLQDDALSEWVKNKNYATPQEAIKAHHHLEKFMGADKAGRGVIIPKDGASDEEWSSFYDKIGRPAKAEDYELPLPEGAPAEFADAMSKIMHESGVPKKAAQNLAEAWNAYNTQAAQAQTEAQETAFMQQEAQLKKEWGAAYDANIAQAGIAARQFGIDGEKIDALQQALGFDGVMKFLSDLGTKTGDDKFISGFNANVDYARDVMTPQQAESKWQELLADKDFMAKVMAGDPKALAIKSNVARYRP